jgi:hypothetical protein
MYKGVHTRNEFVSYGLFQGNQFQPLQFASETTAAAMNRWIPAWKSVLPFAVDSLWPENYERLSESDPLSEDLEPWSSRSQD